MNHADGSMRQSALDGDLVERMPTDAAEFTDRVMAAIAYARLPTPARTFLSATRAGAGHDAVAALWVAWHLGTVRSWRVAPRVRARSFALVLGVATMLGTTSLAAAAAVHVVAPHFIEQAPAADRVGIDVDGPGPIVDDYTGSDRPHDVDHADQGPTLVDQPDLTHDGDGDLHEGHQPALTHDGDGDLPAGDQPDRIEGGDSGSKDADKSAGTVRGDEGSNGEKPARAEDGDGGSSGGDQPTKTDDGHDAPDGGDEGGSGD